MSDSTSPASQPLPPLPASMPPVIPSNSCASAATCCVHKPHSMILHDPELRQEAAKLKEYIDANNRIKFYLRIVAAALTVACTISLFMTGFDTNELVIGSWFSKPSFLLFTCISFAILSFLLVLDHFSHFLEHFRRTSGLSPRFAHLLCLVMDILFTIFWLASFVGMVMFTHFAYSFGYCRDTQHSDPIGFMRGNASNPLAVYHCDALIASSALSGVICILSCVLVFYSGRNAGRPEHSRLDPHLHRFEVLQVVP